MRGDIGVQTVRAFDQPEWSNGDGKLVWSVSEVELTYHTTLEYEVDLHCPHDWRAARAC